MALLASGDAQGFTSADLLGPYGLLVGAVCAIGWLVKQLADRRKELREADERERALYDRVIDSTSSTAALIERNTRALERFEAKT